MDAPVVHSRVEGEGADPHEKKSVMKKVKAKAKKIKDTMTGHGHQEVEGEDEEVESPEGHGAPIYDSPVKRTDAPAQGGTRAGRDEFNPVVRENNVGVTDPIKSSVPGLHGTTGHDARHEEPKGLGGGTHAPQNTPVSSRPKYDTAAMDVHQVKTSDSGKGGHLGESRLLGKTDILGEETPLPQSSPASSLAHGTRKNGMDVDPKQTLVSGQGGKDPHAPKASPQAYETKATDPTKSGGDNIGVTPMSHSLDKMNLHFDRQHLTNQDKSTGSHDQVSPNKPSNQGSSYIGSATTAIASTATSTKNAVASKLGYGATESAEHVAGAGKPGSSPSEHQNQVLDPSTNEFRPTEAPQVRATIQPDHKTETDLKQSNQAGGTYTGKISSATSAVTDGAISAKNVVASKLGYGPSDQQGLSGSADSGGEDRRGVEP